MSITSGEIPLIFISKLMRVLSNQALVAQPAGAGFHTNTLYKFSQAELVIFFL